MDEVEKFESQQLIKEVLRYSLRYSLSFCRFPKWARLFGYSCTEKADNREIPNKLHSR